MKALASPDRRGIMLIECMVYMALVALILGLAFAAFYRTLEHSTRLNANAADIARTLHAGERWRADVRQATRPLQVTTEAGQLTVTVPQKAGTVRYVFKDGVVSREELPGNRRADVLGKVKRCEFIRDARQHVAVWRWELELAGKQETTRVRPLFTFLAVAAQESKP